MATHYDIESQSLSNKIYLIMTKKLHFEKQAFIKLT